MRLSTPFLLLILAQCLSVLAPLQALAQQDATTPTSRHIWLIALGLLLSAGAVAGVVFSLLRSRRLARLALQQAADNKRLLAMTAPLPGGLFQALHSPGSAPQFIYVDPRLQEVFGIAPEELLENAEALPLHPEDRQRLVAQWGYAAQAGGRLQFSGRLMGSDQERWCLMLADVHENANGSLLYSGVILDVTERKRNEEALLENERRFRTLAENLPGAIYRCFLDQERTMLFISDGVEQLTGRPSSDFIGSAACSLAEIIHPDDLELATRHIADAVARNVNYACDYRITTTQGQISWIHDAGQGVRSELDPDDVLWLDGVMLDITAQKEAEAAMRQAKELADQANSAKGEFLARMSHEIRTPMNSVLGMCHLALQTELNDRQRDYLRKLQAAATSLLGIINDILDFSKIEAGKLEMESLPFWLDAVLDNLENIVSLQAREKGLEFNIIKDENVPEPLQGDPLRLGQVLLNLANNAVKFTDQGFVSVRVGLDEHKGADALLRFTVTDSGIGISQEQQQHLFSSFSQADGSITRKYGGTGLGLAICKRLVQMMHGEITLTSEPGKGSAFSFTARFSLPEEQPPLPGETRGVHNLQTIRGARVLLADDSEINRQIAAEILEQAGLHVVCAENGQQVLELASESSGQEWDAVLMDVQMPVLDGLETTRRLRQSGFTRPVLAMTAHAMAEARQQCLDAGMDDHIPKPLEPQRLYAALLRWIAPTSEETRQAGPQLPPAAETGPETPLPSLPGVDVAAGLQTLGGNDVLYRQLLRQFSATVEQAAAELRQILEGVHESGSDHAEDKDIADAKAPDLNTAREIAHKVKGVAMNLGATQLAAAASELERSAQSHPAGGQSLSDTADAFLAQLEEIRQGLAAWHKDEEPTSGDEETPVPLDTASMAPLLRELADSLDRDIAESLQHMETLRPLCRGQAAPAFSRLDQALSVFDTDAARQYLQELAQAAAIDIGEPEA